MSDARLVDEPGRLCALERYQVLGTPAEASFDRITALVRTVFDVPISAVSLIDRDRQWFKSVQGLDRRETPRDIAFCAHTILTREPLVVPDATLDARFAENPLVTGAPFIRSYAGVPLSSPDGYNLGSLCAIDTRPREFTAAQLALLGQFGALVVEELELRTIAQRDFVTGALTRRAFVEGVDKEIERFARYGRPLGLVVFDIDHFKSFNDRFGHHTGDAVLKACAAACAGALRPADVFGRVGGEEFAICLPESGLAEALACAERLRATIRDIALEGKDMPRVTASFGVSTLRAGESYDGWFARTDEAMYAAKRGGRDQCRTCATTPVADGVA